MSQNVKGTFINGASVGIGETSAELVVPSVGITTMKLTTVGVDSNNTVKTQKSTTNGSAWVDQTTYNSEQTATAITVAGGEQWRLVCVTSQAIKQISYSMSIES